MSDIYLDNNATTMVDPVVVDEMMPFFAEQFGMSTILKFKPVRLNSNRL